MITDLDGFAVANIRFLKGTDRHSTGVAANHRSTTNMDIGAVAGMDLFMTVRTGDHDERFAFQRGRPTCSMKAGQTDFISRSGAVAEL